MLNLNRANPAIDDINVAINDAIERAVMQTAELPRPYLGASIVGGECLRKVQYAPTAISCCRSSRRTTRTGTQSSSDLSDIPF